MPDGGVVIGLAGKGDVEGVRAWISQYYQPGVVNREIEKILERALVNAVKGNHPEVVKCLIEEGRTSADARDLSDPVSS